jgi:hypothetical protein
MSQLRACVSLRLACTVIINSQTICPLLPLKCFLYCTQVMWAHCYHHVQSDDTLDLDAEMDANSHVRTCHITPFRKSRDRIRVYGPHRASDSDMGA